MELAGLPPDGQDLESGEFHRWRGIPFADIGGRLRQLPRASDAE
jgi:hypothetical protein